MIMKKTLIKNASSSTSYLGVFSNLQHYDSTQQAP